MNYRARTLLETAADRSGHIPLIFVTERLRVFLSAFRKIFWMGRNPWPVHFRESHICSRHCNNNCHEWFNGTLSERLGTVRGIQRTDSTLVVASLLCYNFVRPLWDWAGSRPPEQDRHEERGQPRMQVKDHIPLFHRLIKVAALPCI